MTEQEREELAEQMARRIDDFINDTTDWRKVLAVEIARNLCIDKKDFDTLDHSAKEYFLTQARAALAVAEPVIREQADNALREENARLREENWELVARAYALLSLLPPETTCGQVQEARVKLAAIREGGKDG